MIRTKLINDSELGDMWDNPPKRKGFKTAADAMLRGKNFLGKKRIAKDENKKKDPYWGSIRHNQDNEETQIEENWNSMSHEAKELVLHADNDRDLHRQSHEPIIKNLKHKMAKGVYDPEKAKILWRYHADRAAQHYAKHHGDGTPWHKMFTPEHRRQAAEHWEELHRHDLHEEEIADWKSVAEFLSDELDQELDNIGFNEEARQNCVALFEQAVQDKVDNGPIGQAINEFVAEWGFSPFITDEDIDVMQLLANKIQDLEEMISYVEDESMSIVEELNKNNNLHEDTLYPTTFRSQRPPKRSRVQEDLECTDNEGAAWTQEQEVQNRTMQHYMDHF